MNGILFEEDTHGGLVTVYDMDSADKNAFTTRDQVRATQHGQMILSYGFQVSKIRDAAQVKEMSESLPDPAMKEAFAAGKMVELGYEVCTPDAELVIVEGEGDSVPTL